jgi:AcrR family transcriptional regulator
MATPRRVGAETSKTRSHLLDCAERIMLDEGHAAVTYRASARKAGVTAGLVQYYFPTLDDLFIAILHRHADRNLERLVAALRLRPDEPLRAVWEFNQDETTAVLMTEFLALANHRKNIRSEVAMVTNRSRQEQRAVLKSRWPEYDLPDDELTPEMAVFLLQAIPKMILLEDAVGVPLAHAKIVKLVARYIDSLEHPAGGSDNPRACKAAQKRSRRG